MLKFNSLRIDLTTESGDLSFQTKFESGLNIIRGDNSSGKSTLLSCIWYACGMEELLGGRSESVLQYAVKDYLELDSGPLQIISSYVLLEISNGNDEIVTLKRYIKSQSTSSKLIEIIHGPYITKHDTYKTSSTFVHDGGSAYSDEYGFYRFLEKFMNLELPLVASTSGGSVRLYIQTIFAALFIEQKRGWTDYIANIPYFKIKNAFGKVVEYLLALDVFENDQLRHELAEQAVDIQKRWTEVRYQIKLITDKYTIITKGIPTKVPLDFDGNLVSFNKLYDESELTVYEYISILNKNLETLKERLTSDNSLSTTQESELYEINEQLSTLTMLSDDLAREISINNSSITRHQKSLDSTLEDMDKNRLARKVKELGGEIELEIATDICPTCHQAMDDTLLLADTSVQPMSIDENIKYLDSQKNMLIRYIAGTKDMTIRQQAQLSEVTVELNDLRKNLFALKRGMASADPHLREVTLRKVIQIEDKIEEHAKAIEQASLLVEDLIVISGEFKVSTIAASRLPKDRLSGSDFSKIKTLEKHFLLLAKDFGYRSAEISDIILNKDTYTPYLSGRELREINVKREDSKDTEIDIEDYATHLSEKALKSIKVKIESASSASDFVRLIWAYLISLYSTSNYMFCNHPGVIIFDEPGQHSMSVTSLNELFKNLERQSGLQSIIAASFDESDETYSTATSGVAPNLIRLKRKLFVDER